MIIWIMNFLMNDEFLIKNLYFYVSNIKFSYTQNIVQISIFVTSSK